MYVTENQLRAETNINIREYLLALVVFVKKNLVTNTHYVRNSMSYFSIENKPINIIKCNSIYMHKSII